MSAPCPLAVMDAIEHSVEQALVPSNDYRRELRAIQQAIPEARAAVAELVEAVKAWDRWNYEVQSARATGESMYSYHDLKEMRERAEDLTRAALAKFGGAK